MTDRRRPTYRLLRWAYRHATPRLAWMFAGIGIAFAVSSFAQVVPSAVSGKTFEVGPNALLLVGAILAFLMNGLVAILAYMKGRETIAKVAAVETKVDGRMTEILALTKANAEADAKEREGLARAAGMEEESSRRLVEQGRRAELVADVIKPIQDSHKEGPTK